MEFEFIEGSRVIGRGKIKSIINDKLKKMMILAMSSLVDNLNYRHDYGNTRRL
jgi:hypothetical protein